MTRAPLLIRIGQEFLYNLELEATCDLEPCANSKPCDVVACISFAHSAEMSSGLASIALRQTDSINFPT